MFCLKSFHFRSILESITTSFSDSLNLTDFLAVFSNFSATYGVSLAIDFSVTFSLFIYKFSLLLFVFLLNLSANLLAFLNNFFILLIYYSSLNSPNKPYLSNNFFNLSLCLELELSEFEYFYFRSLRIDFSYVLSTGIFIFCIICFTLQKIYLFI